MTTYTGRLLTPQNYEVPAPLDIAVQLGRLPRFAGATRHWPYSVLHHTHACYLLAEARTQHRAAIGMVLLHDAEECATGDIPTTWKSRATRRAQKRLARHIYAAYGITCTKEAESLTHEVDRAILIAEMHLVGPPNVLAHSGLSRVHPDNAATDAVQAAMDTYPAAYDSYSPYGRLVAWFAEALARYTVWTPNYPPAP